MGHILSIVSEENKELAGKILKLAREWPDGFQIDGPVSRMRWVMNNTEGAVFEIEKFYRMPKLLEEANETECLKPLQIEAINEPEAMLFIAPDQDSLIKLIEEQ